MNKFMPLYLAIITLAILCLSHEISGHNLPPQPVQQTPPPTATSRARNVEIVNNIREYLVEHPNLNLIRLYKKEPVTRSQTVKYSLGNRVTGDRLVSQYGNGLMYSERTNVTTQVTYPEFGHGSVVTFVEIDCLQDTNEGNAYVVAGGIGQRFISIALEAMDTERFTYNTHVFGTE